MHSRLGAAAAAFAVTMFAGCSGQPQSNLTPGNGSLTPSLRSQPTSSLMRKATVTETVLHSFSGRPNDGKGAENGLTIVNGTLYGTTPFGGANGHGTVYSITTSGLEKVLYNFPRGKYGRQPQAGLTTVGGVLYGETNYGGASGDGTVFKITTSGAERLLYSFAGSPNDGAYPNGLTNVNGILYGTTFAGGARGYGTVFKITEKGRESILYDFKSGIDGANPGGDLLYANGILYGTTSFGGSGRVQRTGRGTVFKITTAGTYRQLYRFGNKNDGQNPNGSLVNVGGKFYGTTYIGGVDGFGTVFKVSTSGAERVLYGFGGGNDGENPKAGLLNVNGTLYGTTLDGGGPSGDGTVFKITADGKYRKLYRFGESPYDGLDPLSGLIIVNGTLYGTTYHGGANGDGTVFSLSL